MQRWHIGQANTNSSEKTAYIPGPTEMWHERVLLSSHSLLASPRPPQEQNNCDGLVSAFSYPPFGLCMVSMAGREAGRCRDRARLVTRAPAIASETPHWKGESGTPSPGAQRSTGIQDIWKGD